MNIIFILLLALILAVPFVQLPAQTGQSKESLPMSIKDLRNAATEVVPDGRSLSLSAYPWRDFTPNTLPIADGSQMMVVLRVATSDRKPSKSPWLKAQKLIEQLTKETGGRAFFVEPGSDLSKLVQSVTKALRA